MKKLILFLILTSFTFSQSSTMLLLMGGSDYKNVETSIYLASLTTPISKTYSATLDSFITMVKDSLNITSLSSKFDVMYDLGGETAEQSLKNLVKRSSDATVVNSPTWAQWQGYTGANTKYLNTNYNTNTQAQTFVNGNASYGVYSRVNSQGAYVDIGGYTTSNFAAYLASRAGGNTPYFGVSSNTTKFSTGAATSSLGLYVAVKPDNTNIILYKNSSAIVSTTCPNLTTMPNLNIFILCTNNNGTPAEYTNRQISFAFLGAGLTATEVGKFTNCIEWLQDRKGTGVIP